MMNIFDLENLNDLSKTTKEQIMPSRLRQNTIKLLALFEIKAHLSIDEIVVGMYRKYKENVKRTWVSSTIFNLKKMGKIKRAEGKDGYFEIKDM